jgi:hypothetical protein
MEKVLRIQSLSQMSAISSSAKATKGSIVQSTDRQGSQSHVHTMAGATKSRRSKPEIKVKKNVQDQNIRHAMMQRHIVQLRRTDTLILCV